MALLGLAEATLRDHARSRNSRRSRPGIIVERRVIGIEYLERP
jgi:hypothetical protein